MKIKKIITAVMAVTFSVEVFTSSLFTNSISVANAVTFDDKASVTVDDLRATSAFILNEGYSGIGCAKDLNEDGYINAFDLVIAKQQLAENDVVSLTYFEADTYDVLVDTETSVTFTVDVESVQSLPENSLAVYDEDDNFIAYMNDNGENGDNEANDGIYSAQVDISNDICTLKNYYAATDKVKSNTFEISFYRELTDEEKQTYIDTNNEIFALPYDKAIEYIKNSDDIDGYVESVDEDSVMYVFSSGITAIKSKENNSDITVKGGQPPLNLKDYKQMNSSFVKPLTDFEKLFYKSFTDDVNNALDESKYTSIDKNKKDVAVLCPFRNDRVVGEEEEKISDYLNLFEYDDFEFAGNAIEKALRMGDDYSCTADVYYDEDASIERWKEILRSEYKVVLVDSHGSKFEAKDEWSFNSSHHNFNLSTPKPINTILTGEVFYTNEEYDDDFWSDVRAMRIINCNGFLSVSGKFIDKYADVATLGGENTPLENSLWYLGACYSTSIDSDDNYSLVYNLKKRGAEAVIGFDNKVSMDYCNQILMDLIVNRMILNADTVGDALNGAKGVFGDDIKEDSEPTKCILSGNKDMKLVVGEGKLKYNVVPDKNYVFPTQLNKYQIRLEFYKLVEKNKRPSTESEIFKEKGRTYEHLYEYNGLESEIVNVPEGEYIILAKSYTRAGQQNNEEGELKFITFLEPDINNESDRYYVTIKEDKTTEKKFIVHVAESDIGGVPGLSW